MYNYSGEFAFTVSSKRICDSEDKDDHTCVRFYAF